MSPNFVLKGQIAIFFGFAEPMVYVTTKGW